MNLLHKTHLMDFKIFQSLTFCKAYVFFVINQTYFTSFSKCLLVMWSVQWTSKRKIPGSNPLTGDTYFFQFKASSNFPL